MIVVVGGNLILGNGTLIAGMGAPIEIRPFIQQPDYKLIFECRTAIADEVQSSRIIAENGGVRIEHIHEWSDLNESITTKTAFAGSGDELYIIDYFLKFVGDRSHYNYIFSYTIYSEAA